MKIKQALDKIREDNPEIKTQSDLAEAIGISCPMVTTYINSDSRPNITNASKIWEKFGIQVEPFTELSLQEEVDQRNRVEGMLK